MKSHTRWAFRKKTCRFCNFFLLFLDDFFYQHAGEAVAEIVGLAEFCFERRFA